MNATRCYVSAACVGILSLSVATTAVAQDKASAESLLQQGLELESSGDYTAACPKLEASLKLYPSLNTQFHLADCYEHAGRYASAWIEFTELAGRCKKAGEVAKEAVALARASAIAGKVSHLTIAVATPDVAGLLVKRNGETIPKGSWSTSLPVDPGEYAIDATAPGKQPLHGTIVVGSAGATATFTVGPLKDEVVVASPNDVTATGPSIEPSSRRTWALVVAGVGVVGMGTSAVLAFAAKRRFDAADCDGNACSAAGALARHDAHSLGNVATAVFALGAIGFVGGGILWLTAPTTSDVGSTKPAIAVSFRHDRVVLSGTF